MYSISYNIRTVNCVPPQALCQMTYSNVPCSCIERWPWLKIKVYCDAFPLSKVIDDRMSCKWHYWYYTNNQVSELLVFFWRRQTCDGNKKVIIDDKTFVISDASEMSTGLLVKNALALRKTLNWTRLKTRLLTDR